MNTDNFRDKVVLITGAAGGFGTLLATYLANAGARLMLSDRNQDGVEALAHSLKASGAVVHSYACDISKELQVEALIKDTINVLERIDIAVNNAGLASPMRPLIETTEAELDLNYAVNLKGVFFGMKYQIQQMLGQNGGTILNVASKAGIGGAPKLTAYCAAKHAVVGITKTAALEYARHNIRINAICPYYSPTPLVTEHIDVSLQEMLADGSPMKRLGHPEEIVAAMLMLIDPENSYMNGQAIAVDGGVSAY